MTKKSKIIEELIKECNLNPENYFDKLNDFTEKQLSRILKIAKVL